MVVNLARKGRGRGMRTFIMAAFLAIPVIASAQPALTFAPGLSDSPAAQEVRGMERQMHEA